MAGYVGLIPLNLLGKLVDRPLSRFEKLQQAQSSRLTEQAKPPGYFPEHVVG
jgi:hypothetical protein